MSSLRAMAAITVCAGLLGAVASAQAAAGWQSLDARTAGAATVIDTATSTNGDMVVLYNPTGSNDLYVNQTSAGTWGTGCKIANGTFEPSLVDAQVAINASGAVVAAWRTNASPQQIAAAVRPAGGACGATTDLTAGGSNSAMVTAAIDPAGRAYVGWAIDNNTSASKMRVRAVNGTWGAATTVMSGVTGFAGSFVLAVTSGPKVVAVGGTATAIRMRTYDPNTDGWTLTADAVSAPGGSGTMRVASNPARSDVRVAFSDEGTALYTASVADPSAVEFLSPITARALSGVPAGNQFAWAGSMSMNSSGQVGILWEVSESTAGTTDVVWASSCVPGNAQDSCTSSQLESYTTPTNETSTGDNPYTDRLAVAADGSMTAMWSRHAAQNAPLGGTLRYATRSAAGTWAAAADVPGSGAANLLGVGSGVKPTMLGGDSTGAVTLIGQRQSDGLLASKAFARAPSSMAAPTAVAGANQATVSWTALTANTGFAPISDYTVTAVQDPSKSCTNAGTSCTVTGLATGSTYTFTVAANNTAGSGAASAASNSVTPYGVPGAPTAVLGVRGNGQVALSWTAPGNGGSAITSYTATAVEDPSKTCTSNTGSPITPSCTITGLTNGTAYTFTVTATNAVGQGVASSPSSAVTPTTVPATPTGVSVVRGNGSLAVTWTDPSPATGIGSYTATATPGNLWCSGTSGVSGCTITGLTNGTTYNVTVVAVAAADATLLSLPSSSASGTPATTPGAPGGLSATAGNGSVVLTWSAAAANGSAVVDYTVTGAPGGSCTTAGTTCTITGLQNGTTYTFTVTARNDVGTGSASQPVSAAPVAPPAAEVAAPPPAPGTAPSPAAPAPAKGELTTRKGAKLSQARVLASAGVKAPKGARVTYKVAGAKGGLTVGPGGTLVAGKPGRYRVAVTITPKRGKATRTTVTVVVT